MVKNLPANAGDWIRYLGWEDPLEDGQPTPVFLLGESQKFFYHKMENLIYLFVRTVK